MNIKIPYQWLLEHLEADLSPQALQEKLSLCGPSVERIETIEGDAVFDIETTTNRIDATSVRGIAREAAAILPEFGHQVRLRPISQLKHAQADNSSQKYPALDLSVTNNPQLCHRIVAAKMENINLQPSPAWLQNRLVQVGQRPLNNIVDITNYVMWELGHPIHAFDYDRLVQKTIIVREAKPGEKFTTLENKTYTCVGGEVIFDDGTGTIIDLPGIMGTANTTITSQTKNVLFWIESVSASKIRFASMTHAIRTQAAVLNEKNVDPELAIPTLKRALDLATAIAQGQQASEIFDIYPHPQSSTQITLQQQQLDNYLGISLPPEQVSRILHNLDCQVQIETDPLVEYQVIPPTYRSQDLTIYQDLIEEIARIYGYHKLPSQIMATTIPIHPDGNDYRLEYDVKNWLAGWGALEVYTYSMVSEEQVTQSPHPKNQHLKVANAMASEWQYMRTSLVPSMEQVFTQNNHYSTTIFELQNCYLYQNSSELTHLPQEKLTLALVSNQGYPHLKGLIESLLQTKYHISQLSIQSIELAAYKQAAELILSSTTQPLGIMGITHSGNSFVEIDFSIFKQYARKYPQYQKPKTTPPIVEDLTFKVPDRQEVGPIIQSIKLSSQLIESVQIKSIFEQTSPNNSSRNITFTLTYRDPDKTLTDQEITPIRKNVVHQLASNYKIALVGTIEE